VHIFGRIGKFREGPVDLVPGATFAIDASLPAPAGTVESVGVDYAELPEDVVPGDILLLDDGRVELQVGRIDGSRILTTVTVGGKLSDSKGINRKGGGLSTGALTDKDRQDAKTAAQMGVDYIAVSFVRDAADIREARRLMQAANATAGVIAKIERAEALPVIDDIIREADGVMIARGDLGVEIGDAEVPGIWPSSPRETRRASTA
jgi:pyruvate kinase